MDFLGNRVDASVTISEDEGTAALTRLTETKIATGSC